jgi:hypothetical protein
MAKLREAKMKGSGPKVLRPKRRLEPWNGLERWEKTMPDGQLAWVQIGPHTESSRLLRNDTGERFVESAEEVEERRRRLLKDKWMLVRSSQIATASPTQQVLDTARLMGGTSELPVRITRLRSHVALPRPVVDQALRDLHDARKIVLSRDDDTAQLTDDDRADALYVGDSARHLFYLVR